MSTVKKPAAKKATPKVKTSEEYVVAIIEKKQFNPKTGERMSKPYPNTFNRVDWAQFQTSGPGLGWSVIEITEAPAGLNLDYKNP